MKKKNSTDALIATFPPYLRDEAEASSRSLDRQAQEAASLNVIGEIQRMAEPEAKESVTDEIVRVYGAVPAREAKSPTPPTTKACDAVLEEAARLGGEVQGADLTTEAARLGKAV